MEALVFGLRVEVSCSFLGVYLGFKKGLRSHRVEKCCSVFILHTYESRVLSFQVPFPELQT